jgi:hypothetical protein
VQVGVIGKKPKQNGRNFEDLDVEVDEGIDSRDSPYM